MSNEKILETMSEMTKSALERFFVSDEPRTEFHPKVKEQYREVAAKIFAAATPISDGRYQHHRFEGFEVEAIYLDENPDTTFAARVLVASQDEHDSYGLVFSLWNIVRSAVELAELMQATEVYAPLIDRVYANKLDAAVEAL